MDLPILIEIFYKIEYRLTSLTKPVLEVKTSTCSKIKENLFLQFYIYFYIYFDILHRCHRCNSLHCCSNTTLFCLCLINLFAENSELSDFFGRFFTKWNPFDFNKFVSFIKKLFHQIHKRMLFFPNFSFMTTIY